MQWGNDMPAPCGCRTPPVPWTRTVEYLRLSRLIEGLQLLGMKCQTQKSRMDQLREENQNLTKRVDYLQKTVDDLEIVVDGIQAGWTDDNQQFTTDSTIDREYTSAADKKSEGEVVIRTLGSDEAAVPLDTHGPNVRTTLAMATTAAEEWTTEIEETTTAGRTQRTTGAAQTTAATTTTTTTTSPTTTTPPSTTTSPTIETQNEGSGMASHESNTDIIVCDPAVVGGLSKEFDVVDMPCRQQNSATCLTSGFLHKISKLKRKLREQEIQQRQQNVNIELLLQRTASQDFLIAINAADECRPACRVMVDETEDRMHNKLDIYKDQIAQLTADSQRLQTMVDGLLASVTSLTIHQQKLERRCKRCYKPVSILAD